MKKKSKKEKDKPCSDMLLEEAILKQRVFQKYQREMEERTEKYNQSHDSKLQFYLAQGITNKKDYINQALNLAYFYDSNFTGNKDFMHTPDFTQVATNFVRYPIMVASKENTDGSKDIVGVTTLKYERNTEMTDNPYFPTEDENVLMITGVLSRNNALVTEDKKVYGIGRELYKSSIKGAYELNKREKLRLVCEIDCRNFNSLNSIKKAIKDLNDEGISVSAYLRGYYEIIKTPRKIVEAPTFMVEFELNGRKIESEKTTFSYIDCKPKRLYPDLLKEIKRNTTEIKEFITLENNTAIVYHEVQKIKIDDIQLEVGRSADGNERQSVLDPVMLRTLNSNL